MKELGITAEHFFKVAKDIGCSSSILGLIWSKADILRIQASVFRKLGDFQFAASQHGLAVAEQQHVKVVIEQFSQRSFKLRGIIDFGLRNQAQRVRRVADDRVAQEQDAAHLA
jgi:hypothetical protein